MTLYLAVVNSHLYDTKNRKSFQHTATTAILPGEQCIDDCPEMQFFSDNLLRTPA